MHNALELLNIVRAEMHVLALLDELLIRGPYLTVCRDSECTFCRVAKLSFNSSRSLRSAVRSSMSCSSRECAPSMFALAAESASRVAARLAAKESHLRICSVQSRGDRIGVLALSLREGATALLHLLDRLEDLGVLQEATTGLLRQIVTKLRLPRQRRGKFLVKALSLRCLQMVMSGGAMDGGRMRTSAESLAATAACASCSAASARPRFLCSSSRRRKSSRSVQISDKCCWRSSPQAAAFVSFRDARPR